MDRPSFARLCCALVVGFALSAASALAAASRTFSPGDPVQLSRSESLLLEGKYFVGAPKGQEFTVLQHDLRRGLVFLPYVKEDGAVVALSVPPEALEPSPPDAWADLLRGTEAFRDARYEEARRLLLRAAQAEPYRALASSLTTRIQGALTALQRAQASPGPAAQQALATALQPLRDGAEQLVKLGHYSLALALDQGADRLATPAAPVSKLDRAEVLKRVGLAGRALARGRQAVALRKTYEASTQVEEGLQAEPARPDLKALQSRIQEDLKEAEERYEAAKSMRRFEKGAVHALTALEHGLKRSTDHPKLLALKKEMQSLFEERTAPPVTPQLLATAGSALPLKALEEGHRLYTTRCTECHELELLDSRSLTSWRSAVAGMARRANLSAAEESRILEYLAVAQNGLP